MPYKDPHNINWLTILLACLMAFFGGVASYANKFLKGEPFKIWMFVAQIIVSMFAGALVILAASYCSWKPEIAGGVAGLAGWSGAVLVSALEKRLIKKVEND